MFQDGEGLAGTPGSDRNASSGQCAPWAYGLRPRHRAVPHAHVPARPPPRRDGASPPGDRARAVRRGSLGRPQGGCRSTSSGRASPARLARGRAAALNARRLAWGALIMAVAASIGGCGKPVLRVADASLGDYYSNKEFRKLSKEQRAEYCAELARQDSTYKAEMQGLQDELEQSKGRSMRLHAEGDSLFALGTALEKRIAASDSVPPRDGRDSTGAPADHV